MASATNGSNPPLKFDGKKFEQRLEIVNKMITNLKHNAFKNSIMKECQELFYFMKFHEKLNRDPFLLGFTNGVLDARQTILKFRDGQPTDYISLSTKYAFKDDYSWKHQDVVDVEDHFTKVFPDPDLKQYFLEYCALLIRGGNIQKTVLSQTGSGNNAKTVNQTLIKNMLGDYFRPLPTTLITGERTQSSAATPELANIEGIRYVSINEPNVGDFVNSGKLKELSGNDEIYMRGLYKDASAVTPMFKLSIICNFLIKISHDDPALWQRLRVLPYESRFLPVNSPEIPLMFQDQLKVKIFPQDPDMDNKLDSMKVAFMWVIWQHYKRITIEGLMCQPEKVNMATINYRKSNDTILKFIEEFIVKDPNAKVPLEFNSVYGLYQTWIKTTSNSKKQHMSDKKELKQDLIAKLGACIKNSWKNWRLKNDKDDDDVLIVETNETDETDETISDAPI